MRFNEKEMSQYSSGPAIKEGRIQHKNPYSGKGGFREGMAYCQKLTTIDFRLILTKQIIGYKERWFKLRGNLLFYYRVNQYGGVQTKEPIGVLIIEMCTVQREDESDLPFAFSICEPLFD